MDTHGLAVDLAVAGAGTALSHSLIADPALADRRLVTLPLPRFPAKEGYYLAQRATQHPKAQAQFIDWFKSATTENA